ncbi:hypothetical protein [Roseovarius sp.]|uniref:hypothetical protein n=1 Tax=Roseovarius sp. TaxID=1486281 RepID=UPI000C3FD07E|nr:hypothetical protein [Roseovarius sp.]MAO27687.1 hypothetical protein [Roseovarius sp.]MAZ22829.1 hypothetical protein [Roseovarius sp.]
MNTDIALVTGLVMVVLSIPAIFSAFSEGRAPRVAAVLLVVGGVMVVWAMHGKPGGIRLEEIPAAVVRVVAMVLN